jgi:outer membrane protein assembly factor BamA
MKLSDLQKVWGLSLDLRKINETLEALQAEKTIEIVVKTRDGKTTVLQAVDTHTVIEAVKTKRNYIRRQIQELGVEIDNA